jgi:hypothetical protein
MKRGQKWLLSVTRTGFVPGAQVQWNGAPRDTTYINSTTLEVLIPASDVLTWGFGTSDCRQSFRWRHLAIRGVHDPLSTETL